MPLYLITADSVIKTIPDVKYMLSDRHMCRHVQLYNFTHMT